MPALPLLSESAGRIIPFHSYIWKVASRCNLNCSYCFVYNMADTRWRRQPAFMSDAVARQAAVRAREHCRKHGKHKVSIIFHGGEPLLGGEDHLGRLIAILKDEFSGSDIKFGIGIQSNGLLFTREIGDLLLEAGPQVGMGISIDGPPEVNDRYRVDHAGKSISARLEERLELLRSPRYRPLFSGFLCVIDPQTDPVRVTDYLLSLDPPSIDFLLPHHSWVHPPRGKEHDPQATPFGDWLARAFDHWFTLGTKTRIRYFDAIISGLFSGPSSVESIGTGVVDLIVVETNGDIEAVDSLKSTYDGATHLGFNVFDDDFDTVAADPRVKARQLHAQGLCRRCQECSLVEVCGAGYLPHRYSGGENFDNPSVYCADLMKIIRHIRRRVAEELRKGKTADAATIPGEANRSPALSGSANPS